MICQHPLTSFSVIVKIPLFIRDAVEKVSQFLGMWRITVFYFCPLLVVPVCYVPLYLY